MCAAKLRKLEAAQVVAAMGPQLQQYRACRLQLRGRLGDVAKAFGDSGQIGAEIGLRVLQPAGLHELVEGKVDVLITRGVSHHPGYRCERINEGSGPGDWLVAWRAAASKARSALSGGRA
ncbi:protein of unknown function [Bradyrhizobium vignae]|uniref:Uncharacterized protein n=1 Tax=Bradyrhizobium vignae TaxID=1549949 RepID=A0A2U3Q160_9BRAD|nr:protein of unknown function [Bradyrhizobium vignae]